MTRLKRLTVLHDSLASYSVAFFRELAVNQGMEIQLIHIPGKPSAPYDNFALDFCKEVCLKTVDRQQELLNKVNAFKPDALLMCSWGHKEYMYVAHVHRKKGIPVIATMDNQWNGTLKQWCGVVVAPLFLRPRISTFFVTGDRQALFARRLGYEDVLTGYATADVKSFIPNNEGEVRKRTFLFVGRLVESKGLRLLHKAYADYRQTVESPWQLVLVGTGPMEEIFRDAPGVSLLGFLDPSLIARAMWQAKALVLPSLFEPWGVVIQEAAAAGLPVICTNVCGSVGAYVRDGINGFVVPRDSCHLMMAMKRMSNLDEWDWYRMSQAGQNIALTATPATVAEYFIESLLWKFGNPAGQAR